MTMLWKQGPNRRDENSRLSLIKFVYMLYCNVEPLPMPLAPALAVLCFQTDSEWVQLSQRTRKYIICTFIM